MIKWVLITVSFLLSLALTIMPLPADLLAVNPSWCLLTLLFWTYGYSRYVNVGVAWCIGVFVDGLTGTLLGMHAFSFVLVVFIFDLFCRRFHMFHVLQQSLVIAVLTGINFLILVIFGQFFSMATMNHLELFGILTTALCWPFYQYLGQRFYSMKG
ncbi:MAG: rod shape-determining protein MreD [Gammaproteobacteria bacterium]|nr:rod shape-determining protein MreD [Gammaproteobacteria bacterium]